MKSPFELVGAIRAHVKGLACLRYGVSIASVLLAAAVRLALLPVLGDDHPYTFFFAAIAFTAWFAGLWPSVMAILLGYVLADWFFVTPHFKLDFKNYSLKDCVGLGGFVCSGLAIALTSKALHAARQRAEDKQQALTREVRERERVVAQLLVAKGQIEDQAARLEQTVGARTAHLAATIQSLEGVCYHLAHDLRCPLRVMQSFSEILLEGHSHRLDAEGRHLLSQIQRSSERMDTLLHCLMDFGRVGHEQFTWEVVDLEAEIDEVRSQFAESIQRTKAEIRVARPLPRIWGSRALVRKVLAQLISNGLKFVPKAVDPALRIYVQTGKSTARLWVCDNGIGIAPEYNEKIFLIFHRLHVGDDYPGTGIGLAIAAKAVQRMGGNVGLQSELGKGSRFWVDFLFPPADVFAEGNDASLQPFAPIAAGHVSV